jgi:hypothetical protein
MVSHTATGEWQSFELRMRRRRAERLALRAEVAAEAGCLDDARECLDEARALAPSLPQLAIIEQKLSAPPPRAARAVIRRAFAIAAVAALALLIAILVPRAPTPTAAAPVVSEPRPGAPLPAAKAVAPSDAAPPVTPSDAVSPVAPSDAVAPVAPRAQPAVAESEPQPRRQELPAASAIATEPLPPVGRVERSLRTEARSAPAAVPAPDATPVPMPPPILAIDLPASTPPPVVESAPVEPPQEPMVRTVLNRYASAYSALDVDGAQRVWPGVNRGALSRAFDSLASQRISFGECRIDVAESSATAQCAGTATWAPKVGDGGTQSEARAWTFELARGADGWRIVSARVQNR